VCELSILCQNHKSNFLNLKFSGLIQGIFETLYDSNVVSEEGFESWVSVDDPLEREGKAVALKMITSFLTWLKEADPESDQEADA
jgi:translation initiation factor 4G